MQLKSEGRDWVFRLLDDHDEFLYEYRQRYEELMEVEKMAYNQEVSDFDIVVAVQVDPMIGFYEHQMNDSK